MQSRLDPRRVTSTRVVYENRWMRVHEDRFTHPDGSPGMYAWVEKPAAALVVAREDGHAWLVEQHRHPPDARYWDFPQGTWEDAPGVDLEALARGELAEETGLRAGTMRRLGRLFYAYGLTSQTVDVWLATGLEPGEPALEITEQGLRSARFADAEVDAMIARGELCDAASVAAWHLATR
jgi:8-oxo-dGTP pyrophosphatase MutT (NUDIX family)